jgi:methionyl-tRNA synthetase
LLCNRPEVSDTVFQWSDFGSKNNNELVKNIGNLCNRFLKLVEKRGGQVPTSGAMTPADTDFLTTSHQAVLRYIEELGAVSIKAGLKTAMELSGQANNYLQEQQLWTMKGEDQIDRANAVMFVAANVLKLVGVLMEPYMPSFSAKLYEQMGLQPTESVGVLKTIAEGGPTIILTLVPAGTHIGSPQPIFKTSI